MSTDNAQDWLLTFHLESERIKENNSVDQNRVARKICITGGKGGVGKTSVALKMALELSRKNKVLLIDCDHNLSNTAIKLGVPLRNDFLQLIKGTKTFEECLYQKGQFHLLSGCNGEMGMLDGDYKLQDFIIDIVQTYQQDFDYILLDSPAGINDHTLDLARYCDDRVFVITPDRSSLTDAYSLMKVLSVKYSIMQNHAIINKVSDSEQYARVVKTISETAESFLQVRTMILGALSFYQAEPDSFDRELLMGKNNLLHKNFIKILTKYTDGIDDTCLLAPQMLANRVNLEQEVPSI